MPPDLPPDVLGGSVALGARGMPAMSAASGMPRSRTETPKYASLARATPTIWSP